MADTMSTNPCRICMGSKMNQSSIFSNDLSRKVTEIADVEVQEGDGLPPTICKDCELDLEKCYKFREQIQWADSKFRENISATEVVFEECQIKQEVGPMHPFINEEDNQDQNDEDDDDDRGPSDNDEDYEMQEEPEDKTERAEKERNEATHPLDHVEIIEHRTKQEIHMSSTDQNSQDEPLIVTQNMKNENEPTTDPLMHNETQSMETDNSVPGPSTSTPMVNRTEPATPSQNWPEKSVSKYKSNMSLNHSVFGDMCLPSYVNVGVGETKENPTRTSFGRSLRSNNASTDNKVSTRTRSKTTPRKVLKVEYTETVEEEMVEKPRPRKTVPKKRKREVIESETEEIEEQNLSQPSDIEEDELPQVESATFCAICQLEFWSPELLKSHIEGTNFTCRVCTEDYQTHSELESHFVTHTPYRCKICKKKFFSRRDVYIHRKNSTTCNAVATCELCKKNFFSKEAYNLHTKNFHTNAQKHICVICQRSYRLNQTLNQHLKTVHIVHEYIECRVCQRLLLGPDRLKNHMKYAHIDGQESSYTFSCPTCSKVFKNEKFLRAHKAIHEYKLSLCDLCGKPFKSKALLNHHIKYQHTKVGTFRCEPCNKYFNTEQKYKNHIKHSTKHKVEDNTPAAFCEICGKGYKTERVLREHLRTHSDEKPFKCQICGAAFKQLVILRTHSRIHSNESKYNCPHCGMAFKWKQTFDNHRKKCLGVPMAPRYHHL